MNGVKVSTNLFFSYVQITSDKLFLRNKSQSKNQYSFTLCTVQLIPFRKKREHQLLYKSA